MSWGEGDEKECHWRVFNDELSLTTELRNCVERLEERVGDLGKGGHLVVDGVRAPLKNLESCLLNSPCGGERLLLLLRFLL